MAFRGMDAPGETSSGEETATFGFAFMWVTNPESIYYDKVKHSTIL